MDKVGILTFHYSNNYGAVLQTTSLFLAVKKLGYDVEVINYIPSSYNPSKLASVVQISKNAIKTKMKDFKFRDYLKKILCVCKYNDSIVHKFDTFRSQHLALSKEVDEKSLLEILDDYSVIIVGSDQVWNPSQRKNPIYFLDFGERFQGRKISYAADSTTSDVNPEVLMDLKRALLDFYRISVRNEHSLEFVRHLLGSDVSIVSDPTLLIDEIVASEKRNDEYIFAYILGSEISGTHNEALKKIREKIGDIPVYSVKIPTMNFNLSPISENVYYDFDPTEWVKLLKNSKFVYTDSFHGVLFALKYHKPFLAYYTEQMRATRFIDLSKRYNIDRYIVQDTSQIEQKGALDQFPCFEEIDALILNQKYESLQFLKNALTENGC